MKKFSRTQVGGRVHDIVSLPAQTAGEAFDSLHDAGFTQCGEIVADEDDEDGNLYPPTRSLVRVGGTLGNVSGIELISTDEDNDAEVGFTCVHDLMKGVFYAKLAPRSSNVLDEDAQRVTKAAITTLIDVAEACASRKITLGLEQSLASHTDLICSLLYLGFQEMLDDEKHPSHNLRCRSCLCESRLWWEWLYSWISILVGQQQVSHRHKPTTLALEHQIAPPTFRTMDRHITTQTAIDEKLVAPMTGFANLPTLRIGIILAEIY